MNCQGTPTIRPDSNLVYLNKIYFSDSQVSCPILYALTTTPETFTQQITFGQPQNSFSGCSCGCGCGCSGCCDFTLTETSTFTITDSRIVVTAFNLSADAQFVAEEVTIDGFPVTELQLVSGQYVADLSGIMEDITECPCTAGRIASCHCMPDDRCNIPCENGGRFFLAQVPGPWVLGATIILEGTVSNGARTCTFRLCLRTIPGDEGGITIPGTDNFAMYCVEIPCQTNGITPALVFDFSACASLLNPVLTVTGTGETAEVSLTTTLVISPEINLQVTKPALFQLNATEVDMECDNVGQCDWCNPNCGPNCGSQNNCGQNSRDGQNCGPNCGCGQNQNAAQPANTGCSSASTACQCCETNGYSF